MIVLSYGNGELVTGIRPRKHILGIPPDARAKLRQRPGQFAKLYLRWPDGRCEEWILRERREFWEPAFKTAANIRIHKS